MTTVLYDYWRSSASYRVRIALNLADEPFDSVPVDLLKGDHRAPDHLVRNPQGLVPVLDIDGQQLTQSLAILEYLNDTRNLNLLPNDPTQRARVRALAHSIAVDLHPVCNLSVVRHATAEAEDKPTATRAWMQQFIRPGLVAFDALLEGFDQTPYCCSSTLSLPDLCLMPQLYNAHRWEADISDLPRLQAIETACAKHPAFSAAHPDKARPN